MLHRFYPNCYFSLRQLLKQSSFLTNPDFEDFDGGGQTEIITATVAQFQLSTAILQPNNTTNRENKQIHRQRRRQRSTDSIKDQDQGVSSNNSKYGTKEEGRSNKKIKKAAETCK